MSEVRRKHIVFWSLVVLWVATDIITKAWAERSLVPERIPHEVIGDYLRFTLVHNRGAAFGMHIGEWSRWVFSVLTVGALGLLAHLFHETRPRDTVRTVALGLVTAGAIGNLIDRILTSRGVTDFIDVGLGARRFWTFNVADVGVSCGAVLLALVLWQEERTRHEQAEAHTPPASPSPPSQSLSS